MNLISHMNNLTTFLNKDEQDRGMKYMLSPGYIIT